MPFHHKKIRILLSSLLLTLAALWLLPTIAAADEAPTPADQLHQAWLNAQNSGRYDYRSVVDETRYPIPSLKNSARQPEDFKLAFSGNLDSDTETMSLTLWQDGSFNPETGIAIEVENGRAMARRGTNGEWEEINNIADFFAPAGDPLAFLAGMQNVTTGETRQFQFGTDTAQTYTSYKFDLNGPIFAEYIRAQMEADMIAGGRLPSGMTLGATDIYQNMSGRGEIWLTDSQMPARIVLDLDFPQTADSGRSQAIITTDFSNYNMENVTLSNLTFMDDAKLWLNYNLPETEAVQQFSFNTAVLLILAVLMLYAMTHRRAQHFYTIIALVVIGTMLIGPLLQSATIHAYYTDHQTDYNQQAAQRQEVENRQNALAQHNTVTWDPHTPPAVQSARPAPVADLTALTATNSDTSNITDSDGDGLSDAAEAEWTSCDGTTTDGYCAGVIDSTDSDGDGLSDGLEVNQLNTSPVLDDTDGDGIKDPLEIQGFAYNVNQTWYLDPTEADTNKDGVLDGLECPQFNELFDVYDPNANCSDSDLDNIPDFFETDNDGDGVPDNIDRSRNAYSPQTYGRTTPFDLTITNLTLSEPVYVDIDIRPIDTDNLALYNHVLDWPSGDYDGQIERVMDTTWANTLNNDIRSTADNAANGDVRLVPMLEVTMPYTDGHYVNLPRNSSFSSGDRNPLFPVDSWLDSAQMDPFSIDVRAEDDNGTLVALVPLASVADEMDRVAAFSARMYYNPSQGTNGVADWGEAHQYRLAWAVQMITDECIDPDKKPSKCERQDVASVVHVYYEDWTMTGLNISEEQGLEAAIIYENPLTDTDLSRNDLLEVTSWNLANTFLRGRDCDSFSTVCTSDGNRDVTIDNLATEVASWITSNNYLQVNTYSYDHSAQLGQMVAEEATSVLNGQFDPYANTTTPLLMYAHESLVRERNLEALGTINDHALTVDFDPNTVKAMRTAGLSWTPYHKIGNEWAAYDNVSYLELLATRLAGDADLQPADNSDESIEEADAKQFFGQLYYATMFQGIAAILAVDGQTVWSESNDVPENEYDPLFKAGTLNGVLTIANLIINPLAILILGQWSEQVQIDANQALYKALGVPNGLTTAIFMTAALGAALIALGYLHDDPKLIRAGEIIMGVITIAVSLTIFAVYYTNVILVALNTGTSMLVAGRAISYAGKFGAGLAITVIWGIALFQIFAGDTDAFARNTIIATAIIQTLAVIAGLILSMLGLGILFFVLMFIDAILLIVGVRSINERATEYFANKLYSVKSVVNNMDSGNRLSIDFPDISLRDPQLGFVESNDIVFTLAITNTIKRNKRFDREQAKNLASFAYSFTRNEQDIHATLQNGDLFDLWVPITTYEKRDGGEFGTLRIPVVRHFQYTETITQTVPLSGIEGINSPMGLYLNEGFLLTYRGCWLGEFNVNSDCDRGQIQDTNHVPLDTVVFDVFPDDLGTFVAGGWSFSDNSGLSFPRQYDLDADGLASGDGTDPDIRNYDTDGDTLSDYYEIANGLDPLSADADGDGLLDPDEIRFGTEPLLADTDGDGLNDYLETVEGWLVNYDDGTGFKAMRVWSDPRAVNEDEDTFDDYFEFALGLHPKVKTDPSIIANFVQIEDFEVHETDGSTLLTTDPVAYFEFEESIGETVFADSVSDTNVGTCLSDEGHCPTAGVAGRFGSGLDFNGTSNMITITNPFSTTHIANEGPFSYAMWVRLDADANTSSRMSLIKEQDASGIAGKHWLELAQGGYPLVDVNSTAGATNTENMTPGQWHHIAFTWDGDSNTGKLYMDNVLLDSVTANIVSPPAYGSGALEIGALVQSNTGNQIWQFDGQIDELVIYDRVITPAEIAEISTGFAQADDLIVTPGAELTYQATITNNLATQDANGYLFGASSYITPSVETPVLYFPFEADDMRTVFSETYVGGRYGATCSEGGSCPTNSTNAQINNSAQFDGVDDYLVAPSLSQGRTGTWFDTPEQQTVSFWFQAISKPAAGEYDIIFDTDETAEGVRPLGALDIKLDSDRHIVFDLGSITDNDGGESATHTSIATLSGWNHVIFTYRPDTSTIVINGVEDSTVEYHEALAPKQVLIGPGRFGSSMAGDNFFHGRLDEFVLHNEDIPSTASDYAEIMAGNYQYAANEDPSVLFEFAETAATRSIGVINKVNNGETAFCEGNDCPTISTTGYFSGALSLDGTNDALTQNHVLDPAVQQFTAMAWIYPTAGNGIILEQSDGNGTGRTWLGLQGSNQLFTNLGGTTVQSSASLSNNQWHHAAVSYDGSTAYLYLNGEIVGQAAVTAESSDGAMQIGSSGSSTNFFAGLIDELFIIPAATEKEGIQSLMTYRYPAISFDEPFTGFQIEPNPVASIDYFSAVSRNDDADDLGANNQPATPCSATCPEIQFGEGISGSVSFDGVDDWMDLGTSFFGNGFVVGFWMRTDSTPANDAMIFAEIEDTNPFDHGTAIELTTGGVLRYTYQAAGSTGVEILGSIPVTDGEWHQITLVGRERVNSVYTARLFVDGQEEGSADVTSIVSTGAGNLTLGRWNAAQSSAYYKGEIDELFFADLQGDKPFTTLSAGRLAADRPVGTEFSTTTVTKTLTVSGTARIADNAGSGYHTIEQTVDAAIELQQQIAQPVVDTNIANLKVLATFEEIPNSSFFENLESTEDDLICDGTTCPLSGLRGAVGRAVLFDGFDDALQGPHVPSHSSTIAAWVNASRGTILDADTGELVLDMSGLLVEGQKLAYNFPQNEWIHIIATINGNTDVVTLYLNGTQVATATIVDASANGIDQIIGANRFLGNTLDGYLDDFRFYNKAFTAAEVAELYEDSVPVLKFEFDEDSSANSFADLSGNQFTGIPTEDSFFNAVLSETVTFNNPAAGTDGQIGNTAIWVNTSGELTVDPADDTPLDLDDEITIMMWVRPDTVGQDADRILLTKGPAAGSTYNYQLELVANSSNLRFSAQNAACSADTVTLTSSSELLDEIWNFVAVTYNGSNVSLYINGNVDNTASATGTMCQNDDPVRMGLNYVGEMDEVSVYGRALTTAELQSIYLRDLRWYRASALREVRIDAEAPTIELHSDIGYRLNGYNQLAVSAIDIWSEVKLFEMGILAPGGADYLWQGSNRCADNPEGVVWCPVFDTNELGGPGTYQIQFRAIDLAGNTTTSSVYTFYVDGTGPTIDTGSNYQGEWMTLNSDPTGIISYTVPLAATITDPVLPDSTAGSGVVSNTVRVGLYHTGTNEFIGYGEIPTMIDNGNGSYTLDYQIVGTVPNGTYSVTITAKDAAGNTTVTSGKTIRLDGRPSLVESPVGLSPADVISQTFAISGTVSELASFGGEYGVYHFENLSGTHAFVDSGTEDLDLHCLANGCPARVSGPFGQSLSLDGTDDVISTTSPFNPISDTFSIALWFKAQDVGNGSLRHLIYLEGGEGGTDTALLSLNAADTLGSSIRNNYHTGVVTVQNDTWHHAAITYDGTSARVYLDGEETVEIGYFTPSFADGDLIIGGGSSTGFFTGQIDELAIYEGALNEAAIFALAQPTGSGIGTVEIGYEQMIAADFAVISESTTINPDFWVPATIDDPSSLVSSWSYEDSTSREGFYAVYARATDQANTVSEVQTLWRGLIDEMPPTVSASAVQTVLTGSLKTVYNFTINDFMLDENTLVQVCPAGDLTIERYASEELVYGDMPYSITGYCVLDDTSASTIDLTICDMAQNCVTETTTVSPNDNPLTIVSPIDGSSYTDVASAIAVPINGTAADSNGIDEISVYIDGAHYATNSYIDSPVFVNWSVTDWPPTTNGTYSVTAVVTNSLNMTATDSVSVSITIPVCEVEYTGDSTTDFSSLDASALTQAIAAAPADSTIKIAGRCFGISSDGAISQTVAISKALTLAGGYEPGGDWTTADPDQFETILDAQQNGRVVTLEDASGVTFKDLVISNGIALDAADSGNPNNAMNSGGAFYVDNSDVTLENVIVRYNAAEWYGGGFYLDNGATVTVHQSDIISNTHPDLRNARGGGFFLRGGTAVSVTESTIAHNVTRGGGAMYIAGGDVYIDKSTISHNTSTGINGGALWMAGDVTIVNSTISNNIAGIGKAGGFEVIGGGRLDLNFTSVVSNTGIGIQSVNIVSMTNSVIANHTTNCNGVITFDGGYNLEGTDSCGLSAGTSITDTDPLLAPLADNFGETLTHLPQSGSPLLDVIPDSVNDCGTVISDDQRGLSRQEYVGGCDIGSVELIPLPLIPPTPQLTINGGTIDLSWPSTSPLCEYDVYESTDPFSNYNQLSTSQSGTSLSTPDTNGDDNDAYYYVSAHCSNGTITSPTIGIFDFGLTAGN